MKLHNVRVYRSDEDLARQDQLAWKIAQVAADPVEVDANVTDMVINRVIDNAAVAAASLTRRPVVSARLQALAHPLPSAEFGELARSAGRPQHGSTVFGERVNARVSPEWAAWANGVAVRELDYHDTFLAAEYSHPGDNIPPVTAVAQHAARFRAHRPRPRARDRDRV